MDRSGRPQLDIGTTVAQSLGDDDEEFPSNAVTSSNFLTIPNAAVGPAELTVTASDNISGTVDIQVINSQNQVNSRSSIAVNLAAGESAAIPLSVTDQVINPATIQVLRFSTHLNLKSGIAASEIRGQLHPTNGISNLDFQNQDFVFRTSDKEFILPAHSVQVTSGNAYYRNAGIKAGISKFVMKTTGDFELTINDFNLASEIGTSPQQISAQIGSEVLVGNVSLAMLTMPPEITLSLKSSLIAPGGKAMGTVTSNLQPQGGDVDLFLYLTIDGTFNAVRKVDSGTWEFESGSMSAGRHVFTGYLFTQSKGEARKIADAKGVSLRGLALIDESLLKESKPSVIQELLKKRGTLLGQISDLELHLNGTRSALGSSISEAIVVQ